MILLVTYIDQNTIEGYVESKEEFIQWLKQHNKQRRAEGTQEENINEFSLKEIQRCEEEQQEEIPKPLCFGTGECKECTICRACIFYKECQKELKRKTEQRKGECETEIKKNNGGK